jgi:hypothetical protein
LLKNNLFIGKYIEMTTQQFMNRSCPICRKKPSKKSFISTPNKAESLTLKKLTSSWNGFFKEKIIFSYTRCDSCGLVYSPIFFNQKELEKLYSQMPANMDEVPITALEATQYGYFKMLEKYSSLEGNLMEIGPDIGLFTKHCVNQGNFKKFWLFEPNKSVKKTLSLVVRNYPSEIVHEMTDFSKVPNHSIDVLIIIHVMDHLIDPCRMLKSLKSKLKDHAKILIVTHDESSLLRKVFGWRWPAFCLQHPQIYNQKTMRQLLEISGFNVITQKKTVNYFKLKFLIKHLFWAIGIRIKFVPDFGGLTLGLKLGNILTIATPNQKGVKSES